MENTNQPGENQGQEQQAQPTFRVSPPTENKTYEPAPVQTFQPATQEPVVEAPEVDAPVEQPAIETPSVTPTIETPVTPVNEIVYDDDAKILEAVRKKLNIELSSLDDLKPKELPKLSERVQKYAEFESATGLGFEEFSQTQKDWTQETPEKVLKAMMKRENPGLDDADIDFQYNRKYGYDAELDEEHVVRSKEIDKKVDLNKALVFFEDEKKKYMVRGADDSIPSEFREAKQTLDQIKQRQAEFEALSGEVSKFNAEATRQVLNDNFEGFKVKVGNEKDGFQELTIKPKDIKATRERQSDLNNFNQKFFDQDGKVTNPTDFNLAYYAADNPQEFANHFFQLGKAAQAEADEKLSKNLTIDGNKTIPPKASQAPTWKKA